mmetsp:Transcript_20544/g.26580  ORF Transcript_20544/g.26580 Transcript_20544/m.26580 type:complete len:102 (-) Transcript_20544:635-940(-)
MKIFPILRNNAYHVPNLFFLFPLISILMNPPYYIGQPTLAYTIAIMETTATKALITIKVLRLISFEESNICVFSVVPLETVLSIDVSSDEKGNISFVLSMS